MLLSFAGVKPYDKSISSRYQILVLKPDEYLLIDNNKGSIGRRKNIKRINTYRFLSLFKVYNAMALNQCSLP